MATGGCRPSSDISECSICLERFREPKLLPCFHTFCSLCLSDHIQGTKRGNKFDCPLCKKSIDVPQNGASGFQTNFYIQLENEAKGGSRTKPVSQNTCDRHSNEELRVICKTCDQFVCLICDKKFHKSHDSELISEEADRARQTLKEDIDISAGKHLVVLREICENTVKRKNDTPHLRNNIIDKIRSQKQKLISSIQRIAEQAEAKVKEEFAYCIEKLNEELVNSQTNLASLDSLLETARLILKEDDDNDIIRNGTSLSNHLKEQMLIQEKNKATTFICNVGFTEENVTDEDLSKLFGTVTIHRNHMPTQHTTEMPRFAQRPSNIKLKLSKQYDVKGPGVYGISTVGGNRAWLNSDTAYLYDNTGKMLHDSSVEAHNLAVDDSGGCFVSLRVHQRCVMHISSSRTVSTFCQIDEGYPKGITFCQNSRGDFLVLVCIGDNKCTKTSGKGSVLQIEYPGGNKSTFCKGLTDPTRVAARTEMEFVAVSDYAEDQVTIYNSSGQICARYRGERLGIKFEPYGLCFDHEGCIIVANQRAGNVLRISTSGQLLQVLLSGKHHVASVAVSTSRQLWVGYQKDFNGKVEIYDIA